MKIIKRKENISEIPGKLIATMGNFDGVHMGHQMILKRVTNRAGETGGKSGVITFHPHPVRVLEGEDKIKLINTFKQRVKLLKDLGIDIIFVIEFTRDIAEMTPAEFVDEYLWRKIDVNELYVGSKFHFGSQGRGDVATLREKGKKRDIKVTGISELIYQSSKLGSSRIRKIIAGGEVSKLPALMGRRYFIDGKIVKGSGRGGELGYPTANLNTHNEILPCNGVYISEVLTGEGKFKSMTYIGDRPTFDDGFAVENYLFEFDGDLIGSEVRTFFHKRLRGDIEFSSPEELIEQMDQDTRKTKEYFKQEEPGARISELSS